MAMFGFASDDRTVDQVRFEDEGMMNFVARDDSPYISEEYQREKHLLRELPPCVRTEANEPTETAEPVVQNQAEKSTSLNS